MLDASLLVAALTNEPHTATAQDWLEEHLRDVLLISDWARAEFSAALSFKVRTGQIPSDEVLQSRLGLDRLCREVLQDYPVSGPHFRLAADIAAHVESGLRAGDSLHLATARDGGATMVTMDRGMCRGAQHVGIPCELLTSA